MPAKRKPATVLELKGSWRKDPRRRRSDVTSWGPIGPPPDHFIEAQREAWEDVIDFAPQGVLKASDVVYVELLSCLWAEYREGPANFTAAKLALLHKMLRDSGLTPASRAYVEPEPDEPEDDEFAEFFQK